MHFLDICRLITFQNFLARQLLASSINDMSSMSVPTSESEERSAAIRCLFPSDSSQESANSQVPEESQSQIENDESQFAAQVAKKVTVVDPISPQQDVDPSTCTPEHSLTPEDSDVSPLSPNEKTASPDPAAYTPEHSPASDGSESNLDTSCSQAIEEMDDNNDPNVMDHYEFKELIVSKSEQRRIVRNSARPTLWRHQRRPMTSLCAFDAVDDGVCIAMTGVLWSIDARMYEIVLVCTLGWADPKKRKVISRWDSTSQFTSSCATPTCRDPKSNLGNYTGVWRPCYSARVVLTVKSTFRTWARPRILQKISSRPTRGITRLGVEYTNSTLAARSNSAEKNRQKWTVDLKKDVMKLTVSVRQNWNVKSGSAS